MKNKKATIILIINVIAFILSLIWIFCSLGLEPIITTLILLVPLVGQICIKKKGSSPKKISTLEKNNNLSPTENNPVITEPSTSFFHGKFCDAFPGLREDIVFFTSKKDIINRLEVLFSSPIYFNDAIGHNTVTDPIWWFRGGSSF